MNDLERAHTISILAGAVGASGPDNQSCLEYSVRSDLQKAIQRLTAEIAPVVAKEPSEFPRPIEVGSGG